VSYSAASSVARLTKNILGPEKNFSFSTCPTIVEVEGWLSSGCSIIETVLTGHKYTAPVTAGTVAYGWISDLNTLYAAGMTEVSRTLTTLSTDERSRGQWMLEQFFDQLEMLVSGKLGDLTLAGLGRTSSGTLYAGGISVSVKQTFESDLNRVNPALARRQFRYPGTLDPVTRTLDRYRWW
jgi:hypothetical protein